MESAEDLGTCSTTLRGGDDHPDARENIDLDRQIKWPIRDIAQTGALDHRLHHRYGLTIFSFGDCLNNLTHNTLVSLGFRSWFFVDISGWSGCAGTLGVVGDPARGLHPSGSEGAAGGDRAFRADGRRSSDRADIQYPDPPRPGRLGRRRVSVRTLFRSLPRAQQRGYRKSLFGPLFEYATASGGLALCLQA